MRWADHRSPVERCPQLSEHPAGDGTTRACSRYARSLLPRVRDQPRPTWKRRPVDSPPMKFRTLLVVALLATAAAAVTSWKLRASAYTKPPAAPGTWHPIVRHQ